MSIGISIGISIGMGISMSISISISIGVSYSTIVRNMIWYRMLSDKLSANRIP